MDFLIADTFTDSLSRLSGDEQRAVKTTAFDLQLNPANPGMSLHKLDKTKDKRFWSVRASGDIRLIVHRSEASLLLCYAGHHDDAYDWAEPWRAPGRRLRRRSAKPPTNFLHRPEVRSRRASINRRSFDDREGARAQSTRRASTSVAGPKHWQTATAIAFLWLTSRLPRVRPV